MSGPLQPVEVGQIWEFLSDGSSLDTYLIVSAVDRGCTSCFRPCFTLANLRTANTFGHVHIVKTDDPIHGWRRIA